MQAEAIIIIGNDDLSCLKFKNCARKRYFTRSLKNLISNILLALGIKTDDSFDEIIVSEVDYCPISSRT